MISTPAREANSLALTTMPCGACTGSVEARAERVAHNTAIATGSRINNLGRDRIKLEGVQEWADS
jgi:hypothetical protein